MLYQLSYLPVGTRIRTADGGSRVLDTRTEDYRTLGGLWSPCLMSIGLGFYPSHMARMVLLQHTLPDGERHFDWLIEPVGAGPGSALAQLADMTKPDDKCLISFRVLDRLDHPKTMAFAADALPLHRRLYLDFQGDVAGKGTVKRIASGMVRKVEIMGHEQDGVMNAISIRGKFTAGGAGLEYTWAGIREGDLWQFQRSQPNKLQNRPAAKPDEGMLNRDVGPGFGWGGSAASSFLDL